MLALLEAFEESYEGKTCGVCGADKWANYFFCRSCSIKLQRAHLMRLLTHLNGIDWMKWKLADLRDGSKRWDLCRDYLLNVNNLPVVDSEEGE